jgi:hypothetical protein
MQPAPIQTRAQAVLAEPDAAASDALRSRQLQSVATSIARTPAIAPVAMPIPQRPRRLSSAIAESSNDVMFGFAPRRR